jgi:hypothetical protein
MRHLTIKFSTSLKLLSHELVTIDRVLEWVIVFIDSLYIQLGTTGNKHYLLSTHFIELTVTNALGLVFTSRILAMNL